MPTATLNPDGVQGTPDWTIGAGTRPTNVASDDGDTSYNYGTTSGEYDMYTMDDMPPASQISRYELFTKQRRTAAANGSRQHRIRHDSTNKNSSDLPNFADTNYALHSTDFAQAPSSGGDVDWTSDIVNGTNAGMGITSTLGSGQINWTWIYAEVDYVPTAGGWWYAVACWLGGLSLGGNLTPDVIAQMFHHMANRFRGRLVLLPGEFELACREIMEAKHVSYLV